MGCVVQYLKLFVVVSLQAVRLESQHIGRIRYLAVVGRVGRQDAEEDCLLGVDFSGEKPSIGLVVPVLADTAISLDGDG